MAKPKREIDPLDLSGPPTTTDFFDALKQILTTDREPVKSENREPTSEELNTKYRLSRKKSTA